LRRTVLDVNLTFMLPLIRAALPSLRERNGAIVLMGSHASRGRAPGGAPERRADGKGVRWVPDAPADTAIGEIELQPARLAAPAFTGLDRLRAV
jgi:NAD(P)-dependent dehydrogenase (short-subunit alcohol dehydrogenase family)